MSALPPDRRRTSQFCRGQLFDPQAQGGEAVAKVPGQLSNKEQVGDRKLKRETKQVLEQVASLQIDQNRSVGDEDRQGAYAAT